MNTSQSTKPASVWRLTVNDEFSAGHALRHYQGKCERLHGHNFAVSAVVEGNALQEDTEMLLDFKILKYCLKSVLEELDHRILNESAPFDQINPSSENLSRYIYQRMAQGLKDYPVRMYSVTVAEKAAQSATYLERLS